MNHSQKLIVSMGVISALCVIPCMAQLTKRVTFDALSAFYGRYAKPPAGSYAVSQPTADGNLLLIKDASGAHAVFLKCVVACFATPHTQSDVIFDEYGKVVFLSAIRVHGHTSAMHILPSKVEQNAATAAVGER